MSDGKRDYERSGDHIREMFATREEFLPRLVWSMVLASPRGQGRARRPGDELWSPTAVRMARRGGRR